MALLAVVGIGIATMVIIGRGNGSIAPSAVSVEEAVRPLNAPTGQTPEGFWYKGQPDAPVQGTTIGVTFPIEQAMRGDGY